MNVEKDTVIPTRCYQEGGDKPCNERRSCFGQTFTRVLPTAKGLKLLK